MKYCVWLMSLGIVTIFASCSSKEESNEDIKLVVTSVIQEDTIISKEYVCQIHAIQHIELRALERGYLTGIFVDEGKYIKKGQLMFQIMPNVYQAEMQVKEAEANFANIEYQNTKRLADSNVVSPNELALAKAKYEKAKADLLLAQTHLGFTEIKAPFDGLMDKFHVRLGSLLDEGDLLTCLSDNSQIWVYFNVPEAEYLNYRTDKDADSIMQVQLLMANNQIFKYPGEVKTIEADFNNETGNIAFRATFPNPDNLLRHGETGNIVVNVPYRNALIIPQKATMEVLEKKYVFVVDKNNIAHQREIHIANELPDLYVIDKGLKKGDKILVEGIRKVQDGQKMEYSYQDPHKIISQLKVDVE